MKQRFNALDIRATVTNLKERLIGLRLQNIYDVNSKTFLFKFAKPDDKELVLIESGTRLHTTQFSREKSAMPSMFCAKLRKHLRTRRLTNVRQVGVDRIVDFEFAGGENSLGFHIIAEFYAAGNIILTDQDYRIMSVLRVVQQSENVTTTVGEVYKMESTLHDFQKVDATKLKQVLAAAGPKDVLKKVLNHGFEYGPAMTEHIILEAGLNPNLKVATELDISDDSPVLDDLLQAFIKGDEMVTSSGNKVSKGYIILMDQVKAGSSKDAENALELYDEFHPYRYHQHENKQVKEFDKFDGAVDEFYSALETQKLEMKVRSQENAALKKLEAVRKEQASRVEGLLSQQMSNTRKAQLIELNLDMVDAAISIIRNAVASQMDWKDLEELVKEEKRRSNPIALMIDGLKLQTNQITLLLSDPDEERSSEDEESGYGSDTSDSEDEQSEPKRAAELYKVDVDILETAFANARSYYDMKKQSAVKHEKTIAATSKALKSAERKIRQDLKETKINVSISKIRKPFWFEKFLWFISTEGHLVIAGRDMQQNEMIVKRYLNKGDVYVHADLHGAASVVVKNKPDMADQPIPPSTLYQAGVMSVCQSKAWDAKIVTSAYWVHPSQVSKSAPTGEYLTTGSFMIRGKKNYLPPVQLVYGYGYLFKLDEASIGNHIAERQKYTVETGDNADESSAKDDSDTQIVSEQAEEVAEQPLDAQLAPTQESSPAGTPTTASAAASDDENQDDQDTKQDDSGSDSSDDDEAFPDTQVAAAPAENVASDDADASNAVPAKKEWNKYDLEDYGHDENELPDFAQPGAPADGSSKKYKSAKERRDEKKGKTGDSTSTSANASDKSKPKQPQQPQQPQVSQRGRKAKAKKIKDKYADQDEEERQLRMELLGSNKGPQPKGKKAKKLAKEKAEKEALDRQRQEQKRQKELKEQQHQDNAKNSKNDKDDIRQMLKEENITMLDADEIANLTVLDQLTANPLEDDIIHFAVPICAPYTALQKYKYKVKLTPGTLKRGKAVKQADMVFLNNVDGSAREKELIKGVPDMEAINAMMSKVKVSAPNLEASKKKKGGRR
ncbi:fibronectin-binding protein A N-terminus-domain-containing protein [Gongronella butleri]|nr:fibronectin-binding protein A N-terminus-domain-containing protein [Gongronella butleri]